MNNINDLHKNKSANFTFIHGFNNYFLLSIIDYPLQIPIPILDSLI